MDNRLKLKSTILAMIPFLGLVCYPLIILILVGWLLIPGTKIYIKEICDIILTTLVLIIPILFVINEKYRRRLALILTYFISAVVFVKLSFYYHYQVKINASAFYVIFETYASETSDFLSNYFDWTVIALVVVLFFPVYVIYRFFETSSGFHFRLKSLLHLSLALILMVVSAYLLHLKFQKENLVIAVTNSYKDYKAYKSSLKDELSKPYSDAFEVTSFSEEPQTNIVIIGESTSRLHMQIYGYDRETTPNLSAMKEEFLLFDNVITPHVHTLLALEKILTLTDYDHPKKKKNGSVIQLANQAGFDTYWLSNQKPFGFHESIAALMGSASKKSYYINSEDFEDIIYDEKLLPVLDSIISKKGEKKLIFVHLIGTHVIYNKRYPKQFEYFRDKDAISSFANKKGKSIIDEYDNAIRYNDYILKTIIEKAKTIESIGYVAYFSDHGDDVYDTMDIVGHNEYYATAPMYEVPFIVWLSDNYIKKHSNSENFKNYLHRPYNLENFIHTFSELTDIKFSGYDETKSLFSSEFKERTRWIKENVDYDHR